MEPKKISFGFSKITKKPNLIPKSASKPEQEKELIKCLEGQEIMLVEERQETAPIVIQMKESGKTSSALASLIKRRAVLLGEDEETNLTNSNRDKSKSNVIINSSLDDLEKRAANEILSDLKKTYEAVRDNGLVLPVKKPDELPLDGAKESNLDDYESIPIEQYGLAMLRGMGWVEPPPSKQRKLADEAPTVRPKGMGLGADKALKAKPLLVQPEANETLEIKKQAFVRILGGKFKDVYGQIEGFDDEAGRVIVKLAIGGSREAFNEFLCQPISKKEYSQYSKCINTEKYQQYKKLENEHGQIVVKSEAPLRLKTETKIEKEEKMFSRKDRDTKIPLHQSSKKYNTSERMAAKNHSSSSSNRRRTRSRTRSTSCSRKYNSSKKYNDEKYSNGINESTTNESDGDSAYEQHKQRSTSKSSKEKSKKSKKKSKHHRPNSGDESSHSDGSDKERLTKRDHRSSKKNKKKTKKSKKKRSRTPKKHKK